MYKESKLYKQRFEETKIPLIFIKLHESTSCLLPFLPHLLYLWICESFVFWINWIQVEHTLFLNTTEYMLKLMYTILFFWLSHLSSIGLDDWQCVKGVLLARFTQWNSITLLIQLVRIQRLAKSLTLWHHAPPRSFPQLMPTVLWNTAFTDVAMFVLFYYASHWKHTVVQCLAAGMIRCGLIISNYTMRCPHTA